MFSSSNLELPITPTTSIIQHKQNQRTVQNQIEQQGPPNPQTDHHKHQNSKNSINQSASNKITQNITPYASLNHQTTRKHTIKRESEQMIMIMIMNEPGLKGGQDGR